MRFLGQLALKSNGFNLIHTILSAISVNCSIKAVLGPHNKYKGENFRITIDSSDDSLLVGHLFSIGPDNVILGSDLTDKPKLTLLSNNTGKKKRKLVRFIVSKQITDKVEVEKIKCEIKENLKNNLMQFTSKVNSIMLENGQTDKVMDNESTSGGEIPPIDKNDTLQEYNTKIDAFLNSIAAKQTEIIDKFSGANEDELRKYYRLHLVELDILPLLAFQEKKILEANEKLKSSGVAISELNNNVYMKKQFTEEELNNLNAIEFKQLDGETYIKKDVASQTAAVCSEIPTIKLKNIWRLITNFTELKLWKNSEITSKKAEELTKEWLSSKKSHLATVSQIGWFSTKQEYNTLKSILKSVDSTFSGIINNAEKSSEWSLYAPKTLETISTIDSACAGESSKDIIDTAVQEIEERKKKRDE